MIRFLSLSPLLFFFFNAFKLKLGRRLELSLGGIFQPNTFLQSVQEEGNKRPCPAVLQSAASTRWRSVDLSLLQDDSMPPAFPRGYWEQLIHQAKTSQQNTLLQQMSPLVFTHGQTRSSRALLKGPSLLDTDREHAPLHTPAPMAPMAWSRSPRPAPSPEGALR